ncbi:outer membrane protein assembly factor BamB [Halomonas cibimaris]|uniref:Outer membrane protein assembly factor BamB n=1 Tax=Halomonas cibimaris TaxID=657012 RepID=A0ABP7M2Z1_9GAMM
MIATSSPRRRFSARRLGLGAAAVALLAGCASQGEPLYTPQALTDIDATTRLDTRWDTGIGDGLGRARYPLTPARDGKQLFAADAEGLVVALNADSGERVWEVTLESAVSSGLSAVDGRVYLGSKNGDVIALDQSDGSEQWRARVSSEVLAAPQANRDLLIVQSTDGRITALDRDSGDTRWTYESNLPSLTLRGTATPRAINPVTFAGFANGRLVTLDNRSGQPLWQQQVAIPRGRTEVDRLVDLTGQPLLTPDGRLYVTSYNGRLMALEATRGKLMWERRLSSRHAPLLVGDYLFVVTDDSRVLALDAQNGDTRWENKALKGRWLTAPAFADGRLVVGDFEGYLHLLDAPRGELVGRTRVDRSGITVTPVTEGSTVHVLANDGTLETLDVSP